VRCLVRPRYSNYLSNFFVKSVATNGPAHNSATNMPLNLAYRQKSPLYLKLFNITDELASLDEYYRIPICQNQNNLTLFVNYLSINCQLFGGNTPIAMSIAHSVEQLFRCKLNIHIGVNFVCANRSPRIVGSPPTLFIRRKANSRTHLRYILQPGSGSCRIDIFYNIYQLVKGFDDLTLENT
jgi:hypothetical protein